jgi:integral membrane protein
MNLLNTSVGRLRVIGVVEGASFLLLLGLAMPLKYLAGMPQYVSVIGALHGALWLAYLAALVDVRLNAGWGWPRTGWALVASVLPFGPFVLEAQLRAEARLGAKARQRADERSQSTCDTGALATESS